MRSCPRSSPTLPQSCVSPPRSSTRIFYSYKIQQNNINSITNQLKKSDARKIESFYQKYVCAFNKGEQAQRAKLEKAYQPARLCGALCHQQEREDQSISQSATKYMGLDLTFCIRDKKKEPE